MSHDFSVLYAVHDAVRRDLVRLTEVAGGTSPVRGSRVDGLRSHWALLSGVLGAHERAEDTLLWPALARSAPEGERAAVETALGQHDELAGALAAVTEAFASPEPFGAPVERGRLAGAVRRTAVLADHHFALEERRLIPLLRSWMDPAGWAAFVGGWRADSGPGGVAQVVPFVLEGAHPQRAAGVLAVLDDADRAAYEHTWRPAHRARVSALW